MAKENIVEDFELYKLIALLKNNDRVLPEVCPVEIIACILIVNIFWASYRFYMTCRSCKSL